MKSPRFIHIQRLNKSGFLGQSSKVGHSGAGSTCRDSIDGGILRNTEVRLQENKLKPYFSVKNNWYYFCYILCGFKRDNCILYFIYNYIVIYIKQTYVSHIHLWLYIIYLRLNKIVWLLCLAVKILVKKPVLWWALWHSVLSCYWHLHPIFKSSGICSCHWFWPSFCLTHT